VDLDVVRLVAISSRQAPRAARVPPRQATVPGGGRPTNLHAIDEVKFATSLGIEAIVVEDDKRSAPSTRRSEQVDNQMSALTDEGDVDLDSLETIGGEDDSTTRSVAMTSRRPIVRFVNKVMLDAIRRGASDIHFEPFEKIYRVRLAQDGVLKEIAQPRCSSPRSSRRV
jgi:type IV pilus assembly protein PilB